MNYTITNWHNCYDDSWKGLIVDAAMAHPAKFSRGLITRIIKYALERGYCEPGSTVVDPFGGVALGALPSMQYGLAWVGCELEEKFVTLGRENIELWNGRFASMPRWSGRAVLLQGDSRKLASVIKAAGLVVSSPPYGDSLNTKDEGDDRVRENYPGWHSTGKAGYQRDYGQTPGQLATLPAGAPPLVVGSPPFSPEGNNPAGRHQSVRADYGKYAESPEATGFDTPGQLASLPAGAAPLPPCPPALISSPPFAGNSGGRGEASRNGIDAALFDRHSGGMIGGMGDEPGNLGNLPMGQPVVVGSPPYVDSMEKSGGIDPEKSNHVGGPHSQMNRSDTRYGSTPGQLGVMVAGSPPFENSLQSQDTEFENKRQAARGRNINGAGHLGSLATYGDTEGQIGADSGDTFWAAASLIVQQCAAILPPGAYAFWVVKSYVKNGAIVEFPAQWQALCEASGFETVEVIRAWLVKKNGAQAGLDGQMVNKDVARKSFFRRLAERKGSPPIDFETVLVMRRTDKQVTLPAA